MLTLLPVTAAAHKQVAAERGILQIRPDAVEVLYEITFATGDESARWRLLYDQNRDGRLSKEEYQAMAKGVAERLRDRFRLKFDGQPMRVEITDAKIATSDSARPFAGPLQAAVMLRAADLAPGPRKITVDVAPVTDTKAPAIVRIESEGCAIREVSGAPVLKMADGQKAVQLREGWPAVILVDFPLPDAGSR